MQACNLTRLLLKMAVTMADRYESALKTLENIAEAGGYMKMVVREDMQKAVSIIRNCFKELTSTGDDKIRKGDQIEVKEGESEYHCEEGDGHNMGENILRNVYMQFGLVHINFPCSVLQLFYSIDDHCAF